MKAMLAKFLKKDQVQVDKPVDDKGDDLENPFVSPVSSLSSEPSLDLSNVEDPELLAAEHKDSRYKTLLNALPNLSFSSGYSLLAFQTGGFGLRGALVKNSKHLASITAVAESRNVDFTRAIAEVLDQLKVEHKNLPKQAILVTPSVISSIVELPVSPLRPRSDDEMRELIRWELEGTLTQQNKHWLIGSMLVERGYLTASQRDELVEELKIRQNQSGQDGLIRFGDLGVQLNYITQEQLEECFVLQGKLIAIDDDLAYGWQAEEPQLSQGISDEQLLSADEDGDSAHKWLVSGMSKSVRRRWVGAFNLNGIKVQAFYPSIGSSFALLPQRCSDQQHALLEIHQEQLAFISGHQNAVNEIRVEERQFGEVRQDELQRLIGILPADLNKLFVNFQSKEQDELLFTLSNTISVEIETLAFNELDVQMPDHLQGETLLAVMGAVDHFFAHVAKARLSWIPARDKELSLWKKLLTPKFFIVTGVSCLAIAMLGFLGWMHWNMWNQEQRLDELTARFEKEKKLKNQFSGIKAGQAQLKGSISAARAELALNTELLGSINTDIPRDKNLTKILLKSIVLVTPEGVSIQSINQADELIMIAAQATSDTQGQEFVSALNKVMQPLNYQVFSSDVSEISAQVEEEHSLYQVNISLSKKVKL